MSGCCECDFLWICRPTTCCGFFPDVRFFCVDLSHSLLYNMLYSYNKSSKWSVSAKVLWVHTYLCICVYTESDVKILCSRWRISHIVSVSVLALVVLLLAVFLPLRHHIQLFVKTRRRTKPSSEGNCTFPLRCTFTSGAGLTQYQK